MRKLSLKEAGLTIVFHPEGETVKKGKIIVVNRSIFGNVPLNNFFSNKLACNANATKNNNYSLWHERQGHLSKGKFLEIKTKKCLTIQIC